MLAAAARPVELIAGLEDVELWSAAVKALLAARPDDGAQRVAELLPAAPAAVLDQVVAVCLGGAQAGQVETIVDAALTEPVKHPEVIFWLWKGPQAHATLSLPSDLDLFSAILGTLTALGRSLNPGEAAMKRFRHRVKAALALKDYARVKSAISSIDLNRAITIRQQLVRLEGLGDNARTAMLDILRSRFPELWRVVEQRVEPWEDAAVLYNTRQGIERRTAERDHMINVTMRENARRIGEAAALGDLSENSEYKFALEERDMLRARLALMNNELSLAATIDPGEVPTDHVGIGSRVVLRPTAGGEPREMTFLGPFDGNLERGIYNYRAPTSQKLLGHRVGDRVALAFEGPEVEFEIVEIANGLAGR
jgi:transcription elongation GreA/GreB family factor